ncbi:MAG: glycosyltransferase, partial [Candidatus Dormibacteria bacterium]
MGVPLVSLVVPTRNEADNVAPLVARLSAALEGVEFELVFVDDSDDATSELLASLERERPDVKAVIRRGADRAGGLATAVLTGIRHARGTFVCVMDADLQHPPEVIPLLLDRATAGADLVVASRYTRDGGGTGGLDGWSRRAVSRGASMAAQRLFKEARKSTDPLSGFFLCRRRLIDGIEFRPVGFKILLELLVCVPNLRVVDVPVTQEQRQFGTSKAGMNQGLMYLRHLRSLFMDVPGSARRWKFGIVGLSGVAIMVPVVWALTAVGVNPLIAFLPAFAVSAASNAALNWRWTFADQLRQGGAPRHYLDVAALTGILMFGLFAALIALHVHVVIAALGAVALAMAVNGLANNESVRRQPSAWARIAVDRGVQATLASLAERVGADRAFVLPPDAAVPGLPSGIMAHAVRSKRPLLLSEAPSYRAQTRRNIDSLSRLILPVVNDERVVAVVICERTAPRGFSPTALEVATQAVSDLEGPLAAAAQTAGAAAISTAASAAPST